MPRGPRDSDRRGLGSCRLELALKRRRRVRLRSAARSRLSAATELYGDRRRRGRARARDGMGGLLVMPALAATSNDNLGSAARPSLEVVAPYRLSGGGLDLRALDSHGVRSSSG